MAASFTSVVLVVIPARGRSQGLPGKNLMAVAGVSLVGRAVLAARDFARRTTTPTYVFVDTDDESIATEGRRWGAEVPFLRPAHLAQDTTPTIDNVLHAADRLADAAATSVLLLQPTSPLRDIDDILACWTGYDPERHPSVTSVIPTGHPTALAMRRTPDGVLQWLTTSPPSPRRQDHPEAWWPNGAVYVSSLAILRSTRQFVIEGVTVGIPTNLSHSVDIDGLGDLEAARRHCASAPPIPWPGQTDGAYPLIRHEHDPPPGHQWVEAADRLEGTIERTLAAPADAATVRFGPFAEADQARSALAQIVPLRSTLRTPTVWITAPQRPEDAIAAAALGVTAVTTADETTVRLAAAVDAMAAARKLEHWTD